MKTQTDLPICVGFGISSPEHVEVLKPVCDGMIVGSAIVRRIAAASEGSSTETVLADVDGFAKTMLSAVNE